MPPDADTEGIQVRGNVAFGRVRAYASAVHRHKKLKPMPRHLSRRLKLHHLRAIDAVARYKSLLQASRALFVSQPSLSKSIREIEETVGVTLFERHAKGMRPNRFGALVEGAARRVIAELADLEAQLDQLLEPASGTLTIGALPVTAAGFLPGLLVALRTAMPELSIHVVQGPTEQMLTALRDRNVDVVIGRLYKLDASNDLVREELFDDPISIFARSDHPIATTTSLRQSDIVEYGLVLPDVTHRVGSEIDEALRSLNLEPPQTALRSNSLGLIRELILTSDMLAAMPRLMMAGDLMRGSVRLLSLPKQPERRPSGFFLAEGRELSPVLIAFLDFTRNYVERFRGTVLPFVASDAHADSAYEAG